MTEQSHFTHNFTHKQFFIRKLINQQVLHSSGFFCTSGVFYMFVRLPCTSEGHSDKGAWWKVSKGYTFLSNTAQQVKIQDFHQLRCDTFQWYYNKQDVKFPLENDDHLNQLLSHLEARKLNLKKLIYVEMELVCVVSVYGPDSNCISV